MKPSFVRFGRGPRPLFPSIALVLLIVAAAAFGVRAARKRPPELPVDCPVIVIGLDTVRGDHLGVAGKRPVLTPRIDAFARDGVYFAECRSTAPWTGPSFASIFTGLYPYRHGFLGGDYQRLGDEFTTVAEYFQAEKRPAEAYVAIGWLTWGCGMAQGYSDGLKIPDEGDGEGSRERIRLGLEFTDKHRNENFYLFLHLFDAHAPYTPPAPFDGMYYDGLRNGPGEPLIDMLKSSRNHTQNPDNVGGMYDWLGDTTDPEYPVRQYAAGVSFVDHLVGEFLDRLKASEVYDRSLIILVGDHGEHLGEHGIHFTHAEPYDETLLVPLIIKWPQGRHQGKVVRTQVSTVDILPTILEITGRRPRVVMDGVSLVDLARHPRHRSRSTIMSEGGSSPEEFVKTLVEGKWKLMARWHEGAVRSELFDLKRDPGETVDVAAEHPDVVRRLSDRLMAVIDPTMPFVKAVPPPPAELDEETRKRLRSLGYVN